jgi:hypothetical protein
MSRLACALVLLLAVTTSEWRMRSLARAQDARIAAVVQLFTWARVCHPLPHPVYLIARRPRLAAC